MCIFLVLDLRPCSLICRSAEHSQLQVKLMEAVLLTYEVLHNATYFEKSGLKHLKLDTQNYWKPFPLIYQCLPLHKMGIPAPHLARVLQE